MSSYTDAHHEAAHAVVSARLGLPLDYTSVERRTIGDNDRPEAWTPDSQGRESLGFTTLVEGTVESWQAALPSADARDNLERFGAQAAAGMVAEIDDETGQPNYNHCGDDLYSVGTIGAILGIGDSTEQPAFKKWIQRCVGRAAEVLLEDEGDGWSQVAYALHKRKRLSGDEVREILGLELREAAGEG